MPTTLARGQKSLFTLKPQSGFGPVLSVLLVDYPPDGRKYPGPKSHWNKGIAVNVSCHESRTGTCWINVCRAGRPWAVPSTTLPPSTLYPTPIGEQVLNRRPPLPAPQMPPPPPPPPTPAVSLINPPGGQQRNRGSARERTQSDQQRGVRRRSSRTASIQVDDDDM